MRYTRMSVVATTAWNECETRTTWPNLNHGFANESLLYNGLNRSSYYVPFLMTLTDQGGTWGAQSGKVLHTGFPIATRSDGQHTNGLSHKSLQNASIKPKPINNEKVKTESVMYKTQTPRKKESTTFHANTHTVEVWRHMRMIPSTSVMVHYMKSNIPMDIRMHVHT